MASTTNVDPNEIRKFEELASRWWDKNSEFKPLHDINPLRANWIDNIAPVAEKKYSMSAVEVAFSVSLLLNVALK